MIHVLNYNGNYVHFYYLLMIFFRYTQVKGVGRQQQVCVLFVVVEDLEAVVLCVQTPDPLLCSWSYECSSTLSILDSRGMWSMLIIKWEPVAIRRSPFYAPWIFLNIVLRFTDKTDAA